MATDGTIDNPRKIPAGSIEPVGFYPTVVDLSTGQPLASVELRAMQAQVAFVVKSRPQLDPIEAGVAWIDATWHTGRKGDRADIEWGTDFQATAGTTYVGYGRLIGTPDEPYDVFAYIKAT